MMTCFFDRTVAMMNSIPETHRAVKKLHRFNDRTRSLSDDLSRIRRCWQCVFFFLRKLKLIQRCQLREHAEDTGQKQTERAAEKGDGRD